MCCSPWGHKELDATELNGTEEPHFSPGHFLFMTKTGAGTPGLLRLSSWAGRGTIPRRGHPGHCPSNPSSPGCG